MLTEIRVLQKSRLVELSFEDGKTYQVSCEYLRVHSPSADKANRDHQQDVNIISIEPVGNYALKIVFDDGHDTGLYRYEFLHELAVSYER